MIISNHSGETTATHQHELPIASTTVVAENFSSLPSIVDLEESTEEEGKDEVMPLTTRFWMVPSVVKHRKSHVVLLLDTSGSMRTYDVEGRRLPADVPLGRIH